METADLNAQEKNDLNTIRTKLEDEYDDDAESIITNARYEFIAEVLKETYKKKTQGMTISDKIDRVVTNRWGGTSNLCIGYVYCLLCISYNCWYICNRLANDVLFGEIIPPTVESFLVSIGTADWLVSLIVDGIVAGIGAVLGFVPQMLVLFLFLAILDLVDTWQELPSSWIVSLENLVFLGNLLFQC